MILSLSYSFMLWQIWCLWSHENDILTPEKVETFYFFNNKTTFSCDQSIRSFRELKCYSKAILCFNICINSQAVWQIWVPVHIIFDFETGKNIIFSTLKSKIYLKWYSDLSERLVADRWYCHWAIISCSDRSDAFVTWKWNFYFQKSRNFLLFR